MNTRHALLAILLSFIASFATAGGGGASCRLEDPKVDLSDKASLQKGAQLYVNYCLGCHSLQFQRYSRMGEDLGIPADLVKDNLMFTSDKIGEQMTIAMPQKDAAKWFGAPPPDLSLKSRVRGESWLYTYLRTFYIDESKPWGVNNKCFPDVGMPHVLAPLQGLQAPTTEERLIDGEMKTFKVGLGVVEPGAMSKTEYDSAMRDLVAFMSYVGEPVQLERVALGKKVIFFLLIFLVVAYLLKREYWKDVH